MSYKGVGVQASRAGIPDSVVLRFEGLSSTKEAYRGRGSCTERQRRTRTTLPAGRRCAARRLGARGRQDQPGGQGPQGSSYRTRLRSPNPGAGYRRRQSVIKGTALLSGNSERQHLITVSVLGELKPCRFPRVAPHGSVDDGWVELYAGPAASLFGL